MMNSNEYKQKVEKELKKYIDEKKGSKFQLLESMEYSLLLGGKRIRPIILLEFCSACGGNINAALPFACAVEMIHTYSLIHDDLPCIDDDKLRRGKPANHIVYGDDIALLSGDALISFAFEIMLSKKSIKKVGYEKAVKAAFVLAKESGASGMVEGQVMDLKCEGKQIDINTLNDMDKKKTGALIKAAAKMGCIIAGADDKKIKAAEKYANNIGLAFQIVDDILDVTSDTLKMGKPIGSDKLNNKSTYVSILGVNKSKLIATELMQEAISCLKDFSENTNNLKNIAVLLNDRKT